jgi:hypothetical protein
MNPTTTISEVKIAATSTQSPDHSRAIVELSAVQLILVGGGQASVTLD